MTSVLESDHQILTDLRALLACDAPQQFVPHTLTTPVRDICARLDLPAPQLISGNLVVGDLDAAEYVLSAHLDEASFSVTTVGDGGDGSQITLAACHRLAPGFDHAEITLLGIRDTASATLGHSLVRSAADTVLVAETDADIRLGDRAVYRRPVTLEGNLLTAKAVDDRVGAAIALHAAHRLTRAGLAVAVALSDGEQNRPDSYFSRTFPHLLRRIRPEACIVFVDGMFDQGLARDGIHRPHPGALVVPHSGDGAGYTVAPDMFALLRDTLIPDAAQAGIDVRVSGAYHSRGDDWGMVTNPCGTQHQAFFVSFGGQGPTPAARTIDLTSLRECIRFIDFAAQRLS
ncbi:hypothetical protein ABIA39_008608 [Nocardia sp. GAS34]|uniref:hypothetical protein n=1 Tax=unclassified Nocardia TaxID=2637762 RepID=UPI003D1BC0C5